MFRSKNQNRKTFKKKEGDGTTVFIQFLEKPVSTPRRGNVYNVIVSIRNAKWKVVRRKGGVVYTLASIDRMIPAAVRLGDVDVEPKLVFKIVRKVSRRELMKKKIQAYRNSLDSRNPIPI